MRAEMTSRRFARYTTNIHSTITCVAKAFVDATPFSMPARVRITLPAMRTIELLSTLQIASVLRPAFLAICSASKVSAVSPLCEITINKEFLFKNGSL